MRRHRVLPLCKCGHIRATHITHIARDQFIPETWDACRFFDEATQTRCGCSHYQPQIAEMQPPSAKAEYPK